MCRGKTPLHKDEFSEASVLASLFLYLCIYFIETLRTRFENHVGSVCSRTVPRVCKTVCVLNVVRRILLFVR